MKKISYFLILILVTILHTQCGDDFLNKVDRTSLNAQTFFNDRDQAVSSVNAVYAHLQNISLWGRRIHFMLDFASDEIGPTPNTQGPPFELIQHTFGPQGNEHIVEPWQMFYQIIAKANITIDGVSNMTAEQITDNDKNQVIAQAKFLRALAYFYINALWNGGPVKTIENFEETDVPRSSPAEIWTLIENDLTEAATHLPVVWGEADRGRASKGAALALLGKAHLYQQEYAEAETRLMEVITSGSYFLVGGPNDPAGQATTIDEAINAMRQNHAFGVKNNGEAVFEVQFRAGEGGLSWDSGSARNRAEGTVRPQEYGVDGFSFYNAKPSDKLLAAFERITPGNNDKGNVDPRFQTFFFTKYDTLVKGEETIPYSDILASAGYAWKKYQDENTVQNPGNASDNDVNHDVIRYADVILMAAEAKIMNNKIPEGIDLINLIRRRADPTGTILPDRPANVGVDQAMDYLIHERQIELAGEQVRRTDLVRWGIANQHIANFQPGKHEYFPIPQGEIDSNEAINLEDQNPGYTN